MSGTKPKRRKRKKRKRLKGPVPRVRRREVLQQGNTLIGKNYRWNGTTQMWDYISSSMYNPSALRGIYKSGEVCWDRKNPGPPYRTGGNFTKFSWSDPWDLKHISTYDCTSGLSSYRYIGGFWPSYKVSDIDALYTMNNLHNAILYDTSSLYDISDVEIYGATGWNRSRPGNPVADAGVFLGEIRELPRMLAGTAKFFHNTWRAMGGSLTGFSPKKVADAWLNTQFGWMPFISDLRKFYETYRDSDALISQIIRDNKKWIRRRRTVKNVAETVTLKSSETVTAHRPILSTPFYVSSMVTGSHKLYLTTGQKVWFEGAFRYHIKDTSSPIWRARALVELYGAMPCPSLIWNLTPWSWLVDWYSNVGDVIDNLSTGYADNLAAKYAFIMGTTTLMGVLESTHKLKSGSINDVWLYPLVWKRRNAASPFGFGLTKSDLTPRQWSILSALGITRLKTTW